MTYSGMNGYGYDHMGHPYTSFPINPMNPMNNMNPMGNMNPINPMGNMNQINPMGMNGMNPMGNMNQINPMGMNGMTHMQMQMANPMTRHGKNTSIFLDSSYAWNGIKYQCCPSHHSYS